MIAATRVFGVRVVSRSPPQTVYGLLADATQWKHWAGPLVTESGWEVEPDPGDAGGIRRLGRRPMLVREEITTAQPPYHHGYRLLSGQPVHSYAADVYISPVGAPSRGSIGEQESARPSAARTHIEWSGSVVAAIPGTGEITALLLGRMITGFARRLAAAAEAAALEGAPSRGVGRAETWRP